MTTNKITIWVFKNRPNSYQSYPEPTNKDAFVEVQLDSLSDFDHYVLTKVNDEYYFVAKPTNNYSNYNPETKQWVVDPKKQRQELIRHQAECFRDIAGTINNDLETLETFVSKYDIYEEDINQYESDKASGSAEVPIAVDIECMSNENADGTAEEVCDRYIKYKKFLTSYKSTKDTIMKGLKSELFKSTLETCHDIATKYKTQWQEFYNNSIK